MIKTFFDGRLMTSSSKDATDTPATSDQREPKGRTEDERTGPETDDAPRGNSEASGGQEGPREGDGSDRVDGENGEDEVERLRQELESLNDRHLRLAAEFDNFRRRSHSEMGQSGTRAQAALVAELLDVLDDLERVTSLEPEEATVASVLEGVELVERKLHRTLEEAGLESIDAQDGPFDPNSMEAMMKEPAESEEEDETVARVLQKGFHFKGHLVRPARVSVRKYE